MRVRFKIDMVRWKAGDVAELSESMAQDLIEYGAVERVGDDEPVRSKNSEATIHQAAEHR